MFNKKSFFHFLIVFAIFLSLGNPLLVHPVIAQENLSQNSSNNQGENLSQNSSGSTAGQSIQLKNPLGDVKDIPTLVKKLLEIVLKIGVPLIALSIIYTGYLFIAAQGNPEKLKQAKDTLVYVLIGSAILLGAYVIANAVYNTIQAIRGV